MDHALLLSNISRYITLDKKEEEYLISVFHAKQVKRKHLLLAEGEVNTKVIFVQSGCLRSYAIDKNGVEHVLQFAPPGWWITDMHSFIDQQPARLNIDVIEDAAVLMIQKTDFEELHARIPKFERLNRILAMNAVAAYQYRQIDNISLSAKERYLNFCQLYPSLIQSLPQKQVASYIGVTPEFLSKMINTTIL